MVEENAEARRAPRSEQCKHNNWSKIVQDSHAKEALTKFFKNLYHFPDDPEAMTPRERNMKMDCAAGELVSKRRLENILKKFKH